MQILSRTNDFSTSRNNNSDVNIFSLKYFFISSIYFYRLLDIYYKKSFIYRWRILCFFDLHVIVKLKYNKEVILLFIFFVNLFVCKFIPDFSFVFIETK